MRAVWSWLKELVELDDAIDADAGARALTAAGLEIEAIERPGAGFRGVIVAEVVGKRPHPQADKLTLVDVITEAGGVATQVVCGAPNVPAPGARVLWAPPGAVLPGGLTLAVRAIKGVDSPGMLCSEVELGLGEDDSGIVVFAAASGGGGGAGDPQPALGTSAQVALGVADAIFEVNVPANRADALGHLGLARELAALLGGRVRLPDASLTGVTDDGLDAAALAAVTIADPAGCARFTARVIDGVRVGPSPRWLVQRLRAVGVRSVSNLVDVTNYVLFELGQPQHAYDGATLRGPRGVAALEVRRARADERLTTLDGVERALEPGDLLICDGERPVGLAGVMGGKDTEVTGDTRRIILEAASFDARSVRRTARRLGMHSEASHRFERGVDPELAALASARAARLLARLGGGRVARGLVDVYPRPPQPVTIALRASRATALTGVALSRDRAAELLGRLGVTTRVLDDDRLEARVPSHRADLTREVDLIEDVIRLHGYDAVPATLPAVSQAARSQLDGEQGLRATAARRALAGLGWCEALTFGFSSRERLAALRLPAGDRRARPIALRNPMSVDQAIMRTSLYPNLLAAVARNQAFGVDAVALFEVGGVFLRKPGSDDGDLRELPDEPLALAGVLAGPRPGWPAPSERVDFFDARSALERVLVELLGGEAAAELRWVADATIPYLHPGVAARIETADGARIAEIGEIHPETRGALGIETPVFGFAVELGALPDRLPSQMRPIARHPAVSRDVSFFVAASVPAAEVAAWVREARQPLIESVRLLEDFRDPAHVPAGKKGMLWSITYRASDRTLTDAEVDPVHEALVGALLAALDAQRR